MAAARKKMPAKRAKAGTKRKSPRPPPGKRGTKATKAAADKAAKTAKAAGATGPGQHGKLSAAQRRLRDSAIVARAAAGHTQEQIGEEFGITDRAVRDIVKARRSQPTFFDRPPMDLVEEIARAFHASAGDFEALAAKHAEKMPAIAIGAKKAANDARKELFELASAMGVIPTDLAAMRSEAEMIRIGEEMADCMDDLAEGKITAAEAREFFLEVIQPAERVGV